MKQKREITIILEGGLIQRVEGPLYDWDAKIIDLDIDGAGEDELETVYIYGEEKKAYVHTQGLCCTLTEEDEL
ncbi:MAG: hypothetical protein JXB26_01175 [Candidatus Aminicenantes bacterium]|nr:hypothetical protein [Candidatus Aminicenantes bacterium]